MPETLIEDKPNTIIDEGGESEEAAPKEGDQDSKQVEQNKTPDQKPVDKQVEAKEQGKEEKKATPEKYELKAPKDTFLDPSDVEGTTAIARELGLTAQAAQKVLDVQHHALSSYHRRVMAGHNEQVSQWLAQVEKDPSLGGQNLDATRANVQRALSGHKDLRTMLVDTGYVNHPAIVRFISEVGSKMKDEKLVKGGSGGSVPRDAATVLYSEHEQRTKNS